MNETSLIGGIVAQLAAWSLGNSKIAVIGLSQARNCCFEPFPYPLMEEDLRHVDHENVQRKRTSKLFVLHGGLSSFKSPVSLCRCNY